MRAMKPDLACMVRDFTNGEVWRRFWHPIALSHAEVARRKWLLPRLTALFFDDSTPPWERMSVQAHLAISDVPKRVSLDFRRVWILSEK